MEHWPESLHPVPWDWLLDESNPSVRYFTLTELLDRRPDDLDVFQARETLMNSPDVQRILEGQTADGYWDKPDRYFARFTGTAWRLLLLLELGVDPQHPQLQHAARFLLEHAVDTEWGVCVSRPDSDPVPCYTGLLLWIFARAAMADDMRVRQTLQWVVDTMRFSDGDETVANPDDFCLGRHTCYRGVVPLLRGLMALSSELRTPEVERVLAEGIEFVLIHHLYKRSHNLAKPMNAHLTQLTFPGFYWPDLLEVLLLLTSRGCRDIRMEDAIQYLQKKQRKDGTWVLQRTYTERTKDDVLSFIVPLEERNQPSRWVTLRALITLRRYFSAAA